MAKDYGIAISPDGKRLLFSIPIEMVFNLIEPSKHLEYQSSALTAREKEVFDLICKGLVQKEIADKLNRTVRTVKFHSASIYAKLHMRRDGILQHYGTNSTTTQVVQ